MQVSLEDYTLTNQELPLPSYEETVISTQPSPMVLPSYDEVVDQNNLILSENAASSTNHEISPTGPMCPLGLQALTIHNKIFIYCNAVRKEFYIRNHKQQTLFIVKYSDMKNSDFILKQWTITDLNRIELSVFQLKILLKCFATDKSVVFVATGDNNRKYIGEIVYHGFISVLRVIVKDNTARVLFNIEIPWLIFGCTENIICNVYDGATNNKVAFMQSNEVGVRRCFKELCCNCSNESQEHIYVNFIEDLGIYEKILLIAAAFIINDRIYGVENM